MNNPYSWNSINPALFFGRDLLLADLLSGLSGRLRVSYGIAGGRRMGKTTLLRRIQSDLNAEQNQRAQGGLLVVPVYIDGLTLPRPLLLEQFWSRLASEIAQNLPNFGIDSTPVSDFSSFKSVFEGVLASYLSRTRIIVLFDELEPILAQEWATGFLANWRALLSNSPGLSEYFTSVFVGAHELSLLQKDVGSPLKDILEWRSLRVLGYEDACDLMQIPLTIDWPHEFLQNVYLQTGGQPMLIQYIMQHVISNGNGNPLNAVNDAIGIFNSQRKWQFDDWWNRSLTPSARRIYARICEKEDVTSLRDLALEFGIDEANDGLEVLLHVGLVRDVDDGFAFLYNGDMFRNWHRKYGKISEEVVHDPKIYAKLLEFDKNTALKYSSAWLGYTTMNTNYSGVLAELRGIIEIIADKLAPIEVVKEDSSFKAENGNRSSSPTLRQRLRYAIKKQYQDSELTVEFNSNYSLFEVSCDLLADMFTRAHRNSSAMVHNTATREMAYRALKQWDGLLAQLFIG